MATPRAAAPLAGHTKASSQRLPPEQKRALETFLIAKTRAGFAEDLSASIPAEDRRTEFYEMSTADTTDAKKKAFQRARNKLVESGDLSVSNDQYRLGKLPK